MSFWDLNVEYTLATKLIPGTGPLVSCHSKHAFTIAFEMSCVKM
jgi:hypothetical protein